MAKSTGMGARFFLDGYDLSGDIGSLSRINTARAVNEVPGIDVSAMERLHAHRDGGMEWSAWMNPTAGQSHPVLSAIPSTDRHAMYLDRATIGAAGAACVCKQTDFAPSRGTDGSLTLGVTVESNAYGLEWGDMLTAGKRTDTTATNGAGVDLLASTAFGLQAYLQVFSFTGTSVTVKLQESSDNGGADAWADVTGGGFVAATARGTQRIQTARGLTVERYLRAVTTGTFTSAVFAVLVVKNPISVSF
jgi:hypothetical protein